MPSKNLKFEKFLGDIFKSKKSADAVKDDIVKFVQAMETSYTEMIRGLRDQIAAEIKAAKQIRTEETNAKL